LFFISKKEKRKKKMEDMMEIYNYQDMYLKTHEKCSEYLNKMAKHYLGDGEYMNSEFIRMKIESDIYLYTSARFTSEITLKSLMDIYKMIDYGQTSVAARKAANDISAHLKENIKYTDDLLSKIERNYSDISISLWVKK
jgi:hypothetical protein